MLTTPDVDWTRTAPDQKRGRDVFRAGEERQRLPRLSPLRNFGHVFSRINAIRRDAGSCLRKLAGTRQLTANVSPAAAPTTGVLMTFICDICTSQLSANLRRIYSVRNLDGCQR